MNPTNEPNQNDEIPEIESIIPIRSGSLDEDALSPPRVLADPPSPGVLGAILWCLILVAVLSGSLIFFTILDLTIQRQKDPEIGKLLSAEIDRLRFDGKLGPITTSSVAKGFGGAQLVTLLFIFLVVRVKIGSDWPRKLAFRLPRFSFVLLAMIGLPGLMILHGGVHHLANQIFRVEADQLTNMNEILTNLFQSWPRWLGVLVIGVAPGLGEELWCRGYLGRGLLARYGYVWGIVLTSLFFGLLHVSLPYAMGTAVMGACLHFTYLMTRSLLIPILLHTLNNTLSLLIGLGDIPLGQTNPDELVSIPLYLAAGLLTGAVGYAFYQTRGRLVHEKGKEVHPPFPSVGLPPSGSGVTVIHPGLTLGSIVFVLIGAVAFGCALYSVE
jgi:uncharacterized protein